MAPWELSSPASAASTAAAAAPPAAVHACQQAGPSPASCSALCSAEAGWQETQQQAVHCLPLQPAFGIRLGRAFGERMAEEGAGAHAAAGAAATAGSAVLAPGKEPARPGAIVRMQVEPKTFFSNERTLLHWLKVSVLLMLTALALLSGSFMSKGANAGSRQASKIAGAAIAPVALLFMAYSFHTYRRRNLDMLGRHAVRYDDQRGTAALVTVLLVVMIFAYVSLISLAW